MSTSSRAGPAPAGDGAGDLRNRILRAFTERARHSGLRAVVVAEVARDLGMSTKTLYKHFESKEHLVQALMESWAERLDQELERRRAEEDTTLISRIKTQAEVWTNFRSRYSPVFWTELERDYPGPFKVFDDARQRLRRAAQRRVANRLRPEVNPEMAQELYDVVVRRAVDPDLCERLNLTPKDALVQAIDIWARGAVLPDAR